MPLELEFDRSKGFVKVTGNGPIILTEFAAILDRITHSSAHPPDIDALWDMRQADFSSADGNLWQDIIAVIKKHPKRAHHKVAIVVSNDLAFGMSRMYETLAEDTLPQEVGVYRTYEEGEQWILERRSPTPNTT